MLHRHHDVLEYWDGGSLNISGDIVTMKPDDSGKPTVKPVMSHFFYMDERIPPTLSLDRSRGTGSV